MEYTVIDLFAGAGGLSLGFTQTGRFKIIAAAENNSNARHTYRRNHKVNRFYSDVRTIDYRELTESCGTIDVVIGGPPCQGFSNANRQHTSLISTNNRLVKEYVRAICELRPRAFVMENVAMLRSNVHRFMVENTDLENETVMKLPIADDKIELLPKGSAFYNAVEFAKDTQNIIRYSWDEKLLKAINVLYRYRINRTKFDNSIERYRQFLVAELSKILGKSALKWVEYRDRNMARELLSYMDGTQREFSIVIKAIELSLMVQRMLRKMAELSENNIYVRSYSCENGAVIANIQSYAVFDYVYGVLSDSSYNYKITSKVYNALDYGAPQRRERFIIVGTRDGVDYQIPEAVFADEHHRTVRDAIQDLQNIPADTDIKAPPIELPRVANLSPLAQILRGRILYNHVSTATRSIAQARFKSLKEGQNFHDLKSELKSTYSDAERTQNTIYMRLRYDEPSATVVNVRKSMWIHPELDRAISIREAARLQTFPDSFIFEGSKDSQYQQVGNAVPPVLSNAIAVQLLRALDKATEQ